MPGVVFTTRGALSKSALRQANERLVLNAIRQNPSLSRADIVRMTGLSPSSVTFTVERLKREKMICDQEVENHSRVGRPPSALRLRAEAKMAVGVDITLSGAYVALADLTSRVVRRTLVPWNPSYELFFERIHRAIQGMVESLVPKQVLGVGIGLPGYIDRATGSVRAAENFNWFGVEAGRLLRKRLPFPGRHLDRIIRDEGRLRADSDIEGLRKRLAIDQLRVAISRPTERLLWLDINPSDQIIRQSIAF